MIGINLFHSIMLLLKVIFELLKKCMMHINIESKRFIHDSVD